MFSISRDNDTICAISTPHGVGAISVVRLSGPQAANIVRKTAVFLPTNLESHKVYYGYLSGEDSSEIDEVLVTYFAQGRSFTGEETFEISCHGSPVITQTILQKLIFSGARLAQKGEFTYRAFMNGRIDLTQAESVLMMIESQSKTSARLALRQLRGELSLKFDELEEAITWCLSRLEANIDFASEDIEIASTNEIMSKLNFAESAAALLVDSYKVGRIAREGLRVVLVGAPNVGKSSLLNKLVKENRAIVSDVAGTTRDTIEMQIEINGQKVSFIDTAGIHLTNDKLEQLGIERTKKEISDADIILHVIEALESNDYLSHEFVNQSNAQVIEVVNKIDLNSSYKLQSQQIACSALTGSGIEEILQRISNLFKTTDSESAPTLMVARQYELLSKAQAQMKLAANLLVDNTSPEFVVAELNEALISIMEIKGSRFDDDVLDRVFRDFCLGK